MNLIEFRLLILVKVVITFNLKYVSLEPVPKSPFLANATDEVIEQFMGLLRVPFIDVERKINELDVLVGSLRPEIQETYKDLKYQGIIARLEEEDQRIECVKKTHYVIAHLKALNAAPNIGQLERKKRIQLVFAEYNEYMVHAMTGRIQKIIEDVMQQVTQAVLFSERLITK